MSESGRCRGRRWTAAFAAATMVAAAAGCAGEGAAGIGEEGAIVESDGSAVPVESLFEVLDSVAGPTVADTEVVFVEGDDTITVGGLPVTLALLADYYEVDNITVPPTWPTLDVVQLFRYDVSSAAVFGLAVLAQTTLVTDESARAGLVEDGFAVARHQDSAVVHRSESTNPDSGVTCWVELRYGKRRAGFDPSHQAVLLFAGPGIASSGIIVWGPPSFTGVPGIVGDLVEAVCASRPDGL